MLHFQISQLKSADTQSFLLPFTFLITLLSLLDPCKLLYYLGIYDMARLYVICWAFIFHVSPNFKRRKSYQDVFKFDDLNLGLAEVIEILKATAQKFGKLGLLFFETSKIVYTVLQCSLLTVLGLSSYYHIWIVLGHSATSPSTFLPYQLWKIIIQIRTSKH